MKEQHAVTMTPTLVPQRLTARRHCSTACSLREVAAPGRQAASAARRAVGFTPLEGLVMATRSGWVHPGLVLWLLEHGGLGRAEVADGLERRSELAGLSVTSGDMRDVLSAREAGDRDAALAFDVPEFSR